METIEEIKNNISTREEKVAKYDTFCDGMTINTESLLEFRKTMDSKVRNIYIDNQVENGVDAKTAAIDFDTWYEDVFYSLY